MEAILFDCDGVLVDTERDGHRVAFNEAFRHFNLDIGWSVEEYCDLIKVAGGKERMRHYFDRKGWPETETSQEELIAGLHKLKTDLFMQLIESGSLPLRPGIARIVDEAIQNGVQLAVCSTSNVRAVTRIVEVLLGMERKENIAGIFAGDMVPRKKPDPAVYKLCVEQLHLDPAKCIVVEDSRNGLLAARSAGLKCIITTNDYTRDEDFSEADAIYPELGDDPVQVTLRELQMIVNL